MGTDVEAAWPGSDGADASRTRRPAGLPPALPPPQRPPIAVLPRRDPRRMRPDRGRRCTALRSASSPRPEDTSAATAGLTQTTNRACESSSPEPLTARDSRPTCASSTRRARPCAAATWSGSYADSDQQRDPVATSVLSNLPRASRKPPDLRALDAWEPIQATSTQVPAVLDGASGSITRTSKPEPSSAPRPRSKKITRESGGADRATEHQPRPARRSCHRTCPVRNARFILGVTHPGSWPRWGCGENRR